MAVAATGRALATNDEPPPPRWPERRPDRNILLITFDALCAEDMALYGYQLPTTPRLDEFARKSSVFTNCYSIGTFTTPCVASIQTGLYPSEHGVYHLGGQLRGQHRSRTLPGLMRSAGFATGASISNPHAFFLADGISGDYNIAPQLALPQGLSRTVWEASGLLHPRELTGGRDQELWHFDALLNVLPSMAESYLPRYFSRLKSKFPPEVSFQRAHEVLDRLPDGFFMWIHVMAPHFPYLPDASFANRFLPSDQMRTESQQYRVRLAPQLYAPSQQGLVDKVRLRYDEYLAGADQAFGDFMAGLDSSRRLRNTSVIVPADHGESFAGQLYGHQSRYLTRPQLHIPLIIRTPGQERQKVVRLTTDQTSIAPTILDLAGATRPDWMRSESLLPWIARDDDSNGQGIAFAQYLETNSAFQPLTHGTVGVISNGHQYRFDLDTGHGELRRIADAHQSNGNVLASNPDLEQALRCRLAERFPFVPRNHA